LRIHTCYLVQQHRRILLGSMQAVADGSGNLSRDKTGGGDLVEHRLEEMIVVPVDERYSYRFIAQFFCCRQSAKSSANNDDMWYCSRLIPPLPGHQGCIGLCRICICQGVSSFHLGLLHSLLATYGAEEENLGVSPQKIAALKSPILKYSYQGSKIHP
jgi:hypothetical protein